MRARMCVCARACVHVCGCCSRDGPSETLFLFYAQSGRKITCAFSHPFSHSLACEAIVCVVLFDVRSSLDHTKRQVLDARTPLTRACGWFLLCCPLSPSVSHTYRYRFPPFRKGKFNARSENRYSHVRGVHFNQSKMQCDLDAETLMQCNLAGGSLPGRGWAETSCWSAPPTEVARGATRG